MNIDNYYEYPAGVALSVFLNGLREEKIMASECMKCCHRRVPPRAHCPECFTTTIRYVEVKSVARVITYSRSPLTILKPSKTVMKTWIFARFEETHGGILHLLDPVIEPKLNLRVKPVFQENRVGSIWDIKMFTSLS
ncbi:MAG: zinc ribbon domain-containing protein [Candidatus Caldarchaeum sp.]